MYTNHLENVSYIIKLPNIVKKQKYGGYRKTCYSDWCLLRKPKTKLETLPLRSAAKTIEIMKPECTIVWGGLWKNVDQHRQCSDRGARIYYEP